MHAERWYNGISPAKAEEIIWSCRGINYIDGNEET
jgi:hypothetical protein